MSASHPPVPTPAYRVGAAPAAEPVEPPPPSRFVFLDTEATGLDESRHELTEIAWIVRLEDGTEFERGYFPSHTLDAADDAALELTAYHQRIAGQATTPMSVWLPQFLEDARGAVIVGAVPDFDIRHLLKSCRKLGLEPTWDHHLLDVATLALTLMAPGPEPPRSLARTCEALGISHDKDQAHGALYDARQVRAAFDAVWSLVADLRTTGRPLPQPVPRRVGAEAAGKVSEPAGSELPASTTVPQPQPAGSQESASTSGAPPEPAGEESELEGERGPSAPRPAVTPPTPGPGAGSTTPRPTPGPP